MSVDIEDWIAVKYYSKDRFAVMNPAEFEELFPNDSFEPQSEDSDNLTRYVRVNGCKTAKEYLKKMSQYVVIDVDKELKRLRDSPYFFSEYFERDGKLYWRNYGDDLGVTYMDLNSVNVKEYLNGAYFIEIDTYLNYDVYLRTYVLEVVVEDGVYKIAGKILEYQKYDYSEADEDYYDYDAEDGDDDSDYDGDDDGDYDADDDYDYEGNTTSKKEIRLIWGVYG